MSPRSTAPAVVRVLEADPDLCAALDGEQRRVASSLAVAPGYEFERGPWRFFPEPDPGALGALILEGLIVVRVDAGARAHLELLGAGDVISPWVGSGGEYSVPAVVSARVVSHTRIVLLDRRFALRTARWPEIHGAIVQRLILRSRRLSLQSAINSLPRIDNRLELTLWALADRFGHVTPAGVRLHLPVAHSQLAELIAAQRPSVSTAAARLKSQGRVDRTMRFEWLLHGPPPSRLSPLSRQTGLGGGRVAAI